MQDKKHYANGQVVFQLEGNKMTYYFKSGKIKAVGIYENELMEGEWHFFRETGQLWQVGNFMNGRKNGSWIRYGKDDQVEYSEVFVNNQPVKK